MRRAGQLNEVIEIYELQNVRNGYSELVENWNKKCTTRANVIYTGGTRSLEANEIVHPYNKTFIVRYYVDVEDYDMIHWNGDRYRVVAIDKSRERQEITITTEKVEV